MQMRKTRREPIFPASTGTAEALQAPSVRCFGPGENATEADYQPGDFILTYSTRLFSRLIRFGQSLRYRGDERKYIRWNHAAVIVSPQGDIIEALGTGVQRNHLSKYGPTEYAIVRIDAFAQPHDREQIVAFAEWALGEKYGWATVLSIALNVLTGAKLTFGVDGQNICSGLVARALERSNAIFQTTPSHVTPAELAKLFDVPVPSSLSIRSNLTASPARG